MVQPITANEKPELVLSDQPQSRSAIAFAGGFVLAALLTASATVLLISGEGLAGEATPAVQI
nr:hypothetical protein [Terricaulis sp.]